MNDVKKHICPTCGGTLSVNVERQMYECPFCGVTFDYDYFREENVLDLAAQALTNNEFTSAGNAYDFMLEKEPNNFEALRGKALIAMDIPKIDDISSIDLYSKVNYDAAYKEIDKAIESSKPQDREYFTTMKDIVDAGHEYVDEKAQLEIQKTEREKTRDHISELYSERDAIFIYTSARIRPKKAVMLTIVCYIILCLIIVLGYKYSTRNPYSKAEDLSKYEKQEATSTVVVPYVPAYNNSGDNIQEFINFSKYQEALEREEKRKKDYDEWEEKYKPSDANLICILSTVTIIYLSVVLILFFGGKRYNAEIAKIRAKEDEQLDKIKECEEKMAELKNKIKQGYNHLCELHPVDE